jgi:mono/diheme cytochrome c family protein
MKYGIPVLVLLATACPGPSSKPDPFPPGPAVVGPSAADPSCPVAVKGTSVTVEESAGDIALVFLTTSSIPELRKRAGTMAAMHNEHHSAMAGGAGADHSMHAGGMIRVHSQARTEDIVGGVRIVFTVADAERTPLVEELRMYAQHLGAGTCAMDHEKPIERPVDKPVEPEKPVEPDPEQQKAALVAAELAAYEQAKPVLEKHCAGCHAKGGKGAKASTLRHFEMTAYPFGGHHAETISAEIREVLGATGKKPTMPKNKPGIVQGEELALILAWADAFDATHAAGGHPGHTGGHHH